MTCAVCNLNDELGVCSSSFGPMSFQICAICAGHRAEPESTFIYLYDDVGSKGEGISEMADHFTTYVDGRYIPWPEWRDSRREAEGLKPLASVPA